MNLIALTTTLTTLVAFEIIDPRELSCFPDITERTNAISSCPYTIEADLLPPVWWVEGTLHSLYHARDVAYAGARERLHRAEDYMALVHDCDRTIAMLEEVRLAVSPKYYIYTRREALRRLHDLRAQ